MFVGHVPDALDEEALCDWWDVTEGLLEKATAWDVPFVMMVDSNWRLGLEQSGAVCSENSAAQGVCFLFVNPCLCDESETRVKKQHLKAPVGRQAGDRRRRKKTQLNSMLCRPRGTAGRGRGGRYPLRAHRVNGDGAGVA